MTTPPSQELSDAIFRSYDTRLATVVGRDKLVAAWESELGFTDALVESGITLDEITSGREILCAEADDLERRARIARSIAEAAGGPPKPIARISPIMFRMTREEFEANRDNVGIIRDSVQKWAEDQEKKL